MFENYAKQMQKSLESFTREVSAKEAPHLHRAVEDLCQKAGIEKPTIRFVTKTEKLGPLHQFNYDHGIYAIHPEKPAILFGDKMRAMLGHTADNAKVSEELKAVIAHEITHLKHGDVRLHKILPLNHSPMLGMIAGAAGVWYYQHLQQKADKAREAGMPEAQVHANLMQEWSNSDQSQIALPPTHKHHISAAKTIAGGLMGFGVGVGIFALGHRRMEFHADRGSAELMGSGKPLAHALEMVREGFNKAAGTADKAVIEAARAQNPISSFLSTLTHPKIAERIERLNGFSR